MENEGTVEVEMVKCEECDGSGEVEEDCIACDATGRVIDSCYECEGAGEVEKES